jgi:3'-phosphoadenosine 5'-phosphosulfate sulfotransferase (PAPS reductase)/FAD synthetase
MTGTITETLGAEQIPMFQEEPAEVLSRALEEHDPSQVFALFSGGNDSLALLHWAKHHTSLTAAVHIDTGTALPGVREHAEEMCSRLEVPLIVYETPPTVYEEMVRKHGLPGPGAHLYPYALLKERQLDALKRDFRNGPKDRLMMLMGARRHESVRRMGNSRDISRDGTAVFVNPLIDWTNLDTRRYRKAHDLPLSETAAICHRSGECNCGAFAKPDERDELAYWFPDWWERMAWMERMAASQGHDWLWGERPPKRAIDAMNAVAHDQGVFELGMCEGTCEDRRRGASAA